MFEMILSELKSNNMNKTILQLNNIVEPRKDNKLSRIYDWIMLASIVIGIFPLLFRTQYKVFWYFDVLS